MGLGVILGLLPLVTSLFTQLKTKQKKQGEDPKSSTKPDQNRLGGVVQPKVKLLRNAGMGFRNAGMRFVTSFATYAVESIGKHSSNPSEKRIITAVRYFHRNSLGG